MHALLVELCVPRFGFARGRQQPNSRLPLQLIIQARRLEPTRWRGGKESRNSLGSYDNYTPRPAPTRRVAAAAATRGGPLNLPLFICHRYPFLSTGLSSYVLWDMSDARARALRVSLADGMFCLGVMAGFARRVARELGLSCHCWQAAFLMGGLVGIGFRGIGMGSWGRGIS